MYRVYHMNHYRGCWELVATVKTEQEAQAEAKRATMSKILTKGQQLDPSQFDQLARQG